MGYCKVINVCRCVCVAPNNMSRKSKTAQCRYFVSFMTPLSMTPCTATLTYYNVALVVLADSLGK